MLEQTLGWVQRRCLANRDHELPPNPSAKVVSSISRSEPLPDFGPPGWRFSVGELIRLGRMHLTRS